MDLQELTRERKVAGLLNAIGLVGLALPWFRIYGRPRSALDMIFATGDLSRHATAELLATFGLILGVIGLAELAALYLVWAPAAGDPDRSRLVLAAGATALAVCLLLLVLGFEMGIGYWATTVGAVAVTGLGAHETFR